MVRTGADHLGLPHHVLEMWVLWTHLVKQVHKNEKMIFYEFFLCVLTCGTIFFQITFKYFKLVSFC